MTQPLLRFGVHNFLNASPLLLPLKEQGVDMGFQLFMDSPAALADRLKSNDLDLAMIPSVEYFKLADTYRLVPDICIASRGEVGTVLFLAKKPINEISSIAVDNRSRTSVALLKILFSFSLDVSIHSFPPDLESMLVDHSGALVIGDPAFKLNDLDPSITVYDLSEEWFGQTGKTFVHAVIAVRKKISLNSIQKKFIQQAKVEGCKRIKEVVRDYKGLAGVNIEILEDYLEKKIEYDFDEVALDGLTHFNNLCYQRGIISKKFPIKFI
jgi:chorismate dehydratase